MSETTTPTPKRGRPAKAKDAAATTKPAAKKQTPPPSKPKVRRQEKKSTIKEYRLSKKSGATFLMQQKNVTTISDGKVREIRYCPAEPSVFRDEQSEKSTRKAIIFTDGRLFVRPDQPNLADYLDVHPDNVANGGNRFFLVDERKTTEEKLNKEFVEHDAISLIRTKTLDELLSVAISLNMDIDRPVSEIKHDLMIFAKKRPRVFIDSFDNPTVEMKTKVSQASKYQIINLKENGVFWYDTNKMIISVPAGKDPMDTFVRWCMTESAAPTVAEIDRQLG